MQPEYYRTTVVCPSKRRQNADSVKKPWMGEKLADQVFERRQGLRDQQDQYCQQWRSNIKDERGYVKGTYDPKSDKTKDARGYVVGGGNLLTSLL